MQRIRPFLTFTLLFGLLGACVDDVPTSRRGVDPGNDLQTGGQITSNELARAFQTAGEGGQGAQRRIGTGQFLDPAFFRDNPDGLAEVVPSGAGQVEINLMQASIPAAAEAVLGQILERTYVVSEAVEGRITLQTTRPIAQSALLDLFVDALEVNGARLEQDGDVLRIIPASAARRSIRSVNNVGNASDAIIVAPLRFISATQSAELLQSIVGGGLTISVDQSRNHVLFSGPAQDLEAAIETLNLFDIDVMKGKSTAIVRLDAAEPDAVSNELAVIFDTGPGGSLEGVVQFLPNPRLKAILVIATQPEYIARAEGWIRDLDRTAGSARRYASTYPLNNRSAEILAPILSQMLSQGGIQATTTDAGDEAVVAQPAAGQIQIVADNERNTVIVRAFRAEHEEIARVITELDRRPKQVLLEATIAEVTLNDELDLGVRWFFETGNFSASFSDLATGAVASTFPGFSAVFAGGSDRVVINALSSVTDVKVIASPTLMVLNNQEAELRIGDQVPIVTRTSQSTEDPDAPVVSAIEYRDTGVILRVQPRIGAGEQVVLEIEQETSDVVETITSGIDSPTISQRAVTTNVVVQNGATLILGGIIQERSSQIATKVPGLGDVPVLGAAFRSKRNAVERTELLILIRPRVITSPEDARKVTNFWRSQLTQPDTMVREGIKPGNHSLESLFR